MKTSLINKYFLLSAAMSLALLNGCKKTETVESSVNPSESESQMVLETKETEEDPKESQENDSPQMTPELTFAEELALKSEKYYISSDVLGIEEGGLVINGLGEVSRNNNRNKPTISAVTDVITSENRYYAESYAEYIKHGDYDYEAIPHSRLYDLDGNLICDWKNVRYGQAYYDWVLESDSDNNYFELNESFNSALVNLKDGRRIEKVYGLEAMGEYLILRNGAYQPMGIMAPDGSVKDFPGKDKEAESNSTYRLGDYLIMESSLSEGCCISVFDENLNLKYETGNMLYASSGGSMIGNYLCITENLQDAKVYDLDKSEIGNPVIVFTAPAVLYFDGDYAVTMASDKVTYQLQRVSDGKVLYSSQSEIFVYNFYNNQRSGTKAECFYLNEDGYIKKLNQNGEVESSYKLPETDNLYLRCDEEEIIFSKIDGVQNETGIVDKDFHEVFPYGQYLSIDKTTNYSSTAPKEPSIWICCKNQNKNYYCLYDVYNEDMELIAENMNSVAYPIDGKFAYIKGLTVGLMDVNGKVIFSSRITDLTDN